MQANHHRNIKSGKEYDYLFPKAKGNEITVKWDANVWDTLKLIPKIVQDTLQDTKALSKILKADNVHETCKNIWDFVYNHIQYAHDEEGVEQIRRPARTWMDRERGVDCDCYTVFISSILTNLSIPHTYRITKYKNKEFYQHIYPIVATPDGKYITIDCVVDKFNYEETFTQKHDTTMNLTYLNGIDTEEEKQSLMAVVSKHSDVSELPDFQDFDGLGKTNFFKKLGEKAKQGLHLVNRVNPAMAMLRVGILASMKLNLFQVAKNLRYAYLTDDQAKAQKLDVGKVGHLRTILKKVEDIFYGAGGKPENLKKEILSGRGNRDHAVSGIELTDDFNGVDTYDENTPLTELLSGVYEDETSEAQNGLGVIVTSAAIASVSSVLAIIAGLIKKLGGIKQGSTASDINTSDNGANTTDTTTDETTNTNNMNKNNSLQRTAAPGTEIAKTSDNTSADDTTPAPTLTTMEKAKAWVKENPKKTAAVGIVLVSALVYGGIKLHQHHHNKHKQPALAGAPHKKHGRKKGKSKGKKKQKKSVALL